MIDFPSGIIAQRPSYSLAKSLAAFILVIAAVMPDAFAGQVLYECPPVANAAHYRGRARVDAAIVEFQSAEPRFLLPEDSLEQVIAVKKNMQKLAGPLDCEKTTVKLYSEMPPPSLPDSTPNEASTKNAAPPAPEPIGDDVYEETLNESDSWSAKDRTPASGILGASMDHQFTLAGKSGLGSETLKLKGGSSNFDGKGLFQPLNLDIGYLNFTYKLYANVGFLFHRLVIEGNEDFVQNEDQSARTSSSLLHQDVRFAAGYLASDGKLPDNPTFLALYAGIDHIVMPTMQQHPNNDGNGKIAVKKINALLLGAKYLRHFGDYQFGGQLDIEPYGSGADTLLDFSVEPIATYKLSDNDFIEARISYHSRHIKDSFNCSDVADCSPTSETRMSLVQMLFGLQISI